MDSKKIIITYVNYLGGPIEFFLESWTWIQFSSEKGIWNERKTEQKTLLKSIASWSGGNISCTDPFLAFKTAIEVVNMNDVRVTYSFWENESIWLVQNWEYYKERIRKRLPLPLK